MATNDYPELSNSQLDSAYAASYNSGDAATAQLYAFAIEDRQQSVMSFISNSIGDSPFPLFDAIQAQGGTPTEVSNAQSAITNTVSSEATAVAATAKTAASDVASGIGTGLKIFAGGAGAVLGIALIIGALWLYHETK